MSPRFETDEHEQDEAQESPPRRRAMRGVLLALAVVGLVGGSWWAGHNSKPTAQDGAAVPEIHPDSAPVKEPPKDPGGMVVPDQDSELLNPNAKRKPEELLPPPEAVKQRPAPPPQPQVAAAPPAAPTPAPTSSIPSAPSVTAPTAHPSAGAAAPPAVTSPPPAAPRVAAAPPAKAPPSPANVGGGYRLQLGALRSEEAAKVEWQKLQRLNSDVLGRLSLSVSRVELGAKGTYYRIQAGPVGDAAQAAQDCAALKRRNVSCIIVKP